MIKELMNVTEKTRAAADLMDAFVQSPQFEQFCEAVKPIDLANINSSNTISGSSVEEIQAS